MVALAKLAALLDTARASVRAMQLAADVLRADGDLARAGMLETGATALARALHVAGDALSANLVPEHLADLLAVAGRGLRAIQSVREVLLPHPQGAELELIGQALAKALHDSSEQTVPISVEDVLGDK